MNCVAELAGFLLPYSSNKLQLTESGEKTMDTISVSQALQIAGRAGRFGTKWETGHVTTFKQEEIKVTLQLNLTSCARVNHNKLIIPFSISDHEGATVAIAGRDTVGWPASHLRHVGDLCLPLAQRIPGKYP